MAARGPDSSSLAAAAWQRALERGDPAAVAALAQRVLKVRRDNLIERPWGGAMLASYKRLAPAAGRRFGEAFEISAAPGDAEAGAHPSIVSLEAGHGLPAAEMPLPDLLALAGETLLGAPFVAVHGRSLPLLPKTLDIKELLSVQAHPPGSPEAYIVIAADPEASIRLGFCRAVEPRALALRLHEGRRAQERLLALLGSGRELAPELQRRLAQNLADRPAPIDGAVVSAPASSRAEVDRLVRQLKGLYWEMLELLGELPVRPGQVVFNATRGDGVVSAEVHALGNPGQREILALEVRRPGPTLRAWDHARFPLRPLDIDGALAVLHIGARRPESFLCEPVAVPGRPGVWRSASCAAFVIDHLRPRAGAPVAQPAVAGPHTLHVIRGAVCIERDTGATVLACGESALIPAGFGAYRAVAVGGTADADASAEPELICVTVPLPDGAVLSTGPAAGGRLAAGAGGRGGTGAGRVGDAAGDGAAGGREASAVQAARLANLGALRQVVDESRGPGQVLAIVNGGDGALVAGELTRLRRELFRADGRTSVFAHEERVRRGQLLGLLDAVAAHRAERGALDPDRVAVGIMMPGKGTRLSPITQRLFGIKPFYPMPVRHRVAGASWLSGAAASLYTWSLVAAHLESCGFRGLAWKWGDEPQIPARVLAGARLDLSRADAVRFGAEMEVTEDMACNKEWLFRDAATGQLRKQVRRRPRSELLQAFGLPPAAAPVRALVHVGSPAFSHLFLEEAARVFGDLQGALDVDGYLFEALTATPVEWQRECERDAGLRALLADCPDFYERCQALQQALAARRGHPLVIQVVDFGEGLYWGDVGQLDKARRVFLELADPGEAGGFARTLAALEDAVPDERGNLWVGGSASRGAQVERCVIIDSVLGPEVHARDAVIVSSQVQRGTIAAGAVVLESTLVDADIGPEALSFRSVCAVLRLEAHRVHTSIPVDPAAPERGLEDWLADQRIDPGKGEQYERPQFGNPASFADKFHQMRRRDLPPAETERVIDEQFRAPLRRG